MNNKEKKRRTFIKSLSWRIVATLTTAVLVFIITGEIVLAAQVGMLEFSLKLVFYYLHERAWGLVKWGMFHE